MRTGELNQTLYVFNPRVNKKLLAQLGAPQSGTTISANTTSVTGHCNTCHVQLTVDWEIFTNKIFSPVAQAAKIKRSKISYARI